MKAKFYTTTGMLIGAILLLLASTMNAQTWSYYTPQNSGIPDSNITSVAIESNGTKWLGTPKGLVKFDGTTWTVYDSTNSGLPSNSIVQVIIDSADNKWISFNEYGWLASFGSGQNKDLGLAKYDGTTWTIYNKANSGILNDTVGVIANRKNSTDIYVSYYSAIDGQTISKFDGTSWTHITNTTQAYSFISDMEIANSGTIWITHFNGVSKYKNSTWTNYSGNFSGNAVTQSVSVVIDATGDTSWVSSWSPVVLKIYDSTAVSIKGGACCHPDIAIDAANNKWYCNGQGSSLSKLVNDSLIAYGNPTTGMMHPNCILFDNGYAFIASSSGLGMLAISPTASVLENKINNNENLIALPNPFNNTTNIKYHLDKNAIVNLSVYNLLGECVLKLENNRQQLAGDYLQTIELSQSGIYFVRLNIDGKELCNRIVNAN